MSETEGATQTEEAPGLLTNPGETHTSPPTSWKAELPEELLSNTTIQNAKSVADLARMTVEAQSLVGKDRIALPGPNATVEEKRAFATKIGSPETPDGFQFDLSKWDKESMGDPTELLNEVRNIMFEEGVTKQAGERLMNTLLSTQAESFTQTIEQRNQALTEGMESLKKEWGEAFDKNTALAQYAMNKLDAEGELAELFKTHNLDNNPTLVKFMANAAKQLIDDEYVPGDNGNTKGFGPLSPGDAKAEMARMRTDPEVSKALFDKSHVGHQAAVEKFNYLSEVANDLEK